MTFEVIQPDGSVKLVSGREFTCAKVWAEFNADLKWLVRNIQALRKGESFEHAGRTWKRVM